MPTTGDVLDQHLKYFGENDLDGVVADYSKREGRQMSFVQAKSMEEAFTPTEKTEIVTTPSWPLVDIEDILSAEWEIGGSALPTDAIRGLVAGE